MRTSKTKNAQRRAAIEIGWSTLNVVVGDFHSDGAPSFQTRSVNWRQQATSLVSSGGVEELAAALKRLAAELKLANSSINLTLSGDFCVTRVVTGSEEKVREELSELEHRSGLYLSLGHGTKAMAASIRPIDARLRHALLSVVNQKTLDVIVDAARRSGVQIGRIEPALVSLCRLIGRSGGDAEHPGLIVNFGHRGVELGITHKGVLLLDYRPAGLNSPEQIAATISQHLSRLQRYCDRYVRFTRGKLSDVYLFGSPEAVAQVQQTFQDQSQLRVHSMLNPWSIDTSWQYDEEAPAWTSAAAIGLCLLNESQANDSSPNLLERMHSQTREPLSKLLRPLFWPAAAALVCAAIAWGMVFKQSMDNSQLRAEVTKVEAASREARLLQGRLQKTQARLKLFTHLESKIGRVRWSELSTQIAQCLPADVWLESVTLESSGRLCVSGSSYSEDGIFQFVKLLDGVPALSHVALDATRPIRLAKGSGTQFDVHCDLADFSDKEGRNDGRG